MKTYTLPLAFLLACSTGEKAEEPDADSLGEAVYTADSGQVDSKGADSGVVDEEVEPLLPDLVILGYTVDDTQLTSGSVGYSLEIVNQGEGQAPNSVIYTSVRLVSSNVCNGSGSGGAGPAVEEYTPIEALASGASDTLEGSRSFGPSGEGCQKRITLEVLATADCPEDGCLGAIVEFDETNNSLEFVYESGLFDY